MEGCGLFKWLLYLAAQLKYTKYYYVGSWIPFE